MAEMQACLARLYVDRAFRRLFAIEPESVLSQYRLSTDEAQALQDLDRPALDRFARSLRSKRRRRFVATYPLLFGLGSPAVDRYYDRYYQLYPARPGGSFVDELLEFGRFMEQCLATDDEAPRFASDLARYERIRFDLRRQGRVDEWKSGGAEELKSGAAETDGPGTDDRPRRADGVAVGTFRTGILAIVEALEAGLPPPETGAGPFTFVFRALPDGTEIEAFFVTEATRDLLEECDGVRSVSEVCVAVERRRHPLAWVPDGGPSTSAADAMQALMEHGILTTTRRHAEAVAHHPLRGYPLDDPDPWLPGGH